MSDICALRCIGGAQLPLSVWDSGVRVQLSFACLPCGSAKSYKSALPIATGNAEFEVMRRVRPERIPKAL